MQLKVLRIRHSILFFRMSATIRAERVVLRVFSLLQEFGQRLNNRNAHWKKWIRNLFFSLKSNCHSESFAFAFAFGASSFTHRTNEATVS